MSQQSGIESDKSGEKQSLRPRRRIAFRLLASCISLFLTLVAVEIVFRVFNVRGFHAPRTRGWGHALVSREESEREGYRLRFKPNTRFELSYDSNPTGYFNARNGLEYQTNRFGLRGPDVPIEKAPGVTRILLLGDSFVFGEGVRFEHTTGEQLSQLLNTRSGEQYEVINAGCSSWNSEDEMNFLRREGLAFEPDIILVGYVLNDIAPGVNVWDYVLQTYQNRRLRFSYLASYIYGEIAKRTLTRSYLDEISQVTQNKIHLVNQSLDALAEGNRLARQKGTPFIVFVYPFLYDLSDDYPFRGLTEAVLTGCRQRNIEVIDLFPRYRGRDHRSLWAHPYSDPHPNRLGHQIAAEALAEYLLRR